MSDTMIESQPKPAEPATAPRSVVIRHWNDETEFVVHWKNLQTGGFYQGTYTDDFKDALEEYFARCDKENIDYTPIRGDKNERQD